MASTVVEWEEWERPMLLGGVLGGVAYELRTKLAPNCHSPSLNPAKVHDISADWRGDPRRGN